VSNWTLQELVDRVANQIAALPAPKNGQVRAVPDERTIRYYQTIGLLDRPLATRGRTALYGDKHVAQIVAIKRMQAMGRSLAEIQLVWPSLDAVALTRMSGIPIEQGLQPSSRPAFWKQEPAALDAVERGPAQDAPALEPVVQLEVRIELGPGVVLALARTNDLGALSLSPADLAAIHAAAAPLLSELASRQLAAYPTTDGRRHP
jgi:hypothetical protein